MGKTELSHDTAASVVSLVGPWSRASCACINRTWKRAVEQVSFPDATNGHWLVEADGIGGRLWMCNLVSGRQKVVELDLPWDSIPTDLAQEEVAHSVYLWETWLSRVVCTFRGLVLICLGRRHEHVLFLGDPLLNKWVKLPSFHPGRPNRFTSVGAFCPRTSTLLVSNSRTATFDLESARWKVDPPLPRDSYLHGGHEMTQVCCLDGVFYCGFRTYPFERADPRFYTRDGFGIACYDPVNAREWRIVKEFYLVFSEELPVYLAQQSDSKMLLCMIPDDGHTGHFRLFEASRPGAGGSNELEIVPSLLLEDEHIGKRIKSLLCYDKKAEPEEEGEEEGDEDSWPIFHGKDGMLFWEEFDMCKRDTMTVASLSDGNVKEIKCTRNTDPQVPPRKYCYTAAPGTRELLEDLAVKLNTA